MDEEPQAFGARQKRAAFRMITVDKHNSQEYIVAIDKFKLQ